MNCFDIQDRIIELIMGELNQQERFVIEEHINSCPVCYEDFRFLSECLKVYEYPEIEQFDETYWEEFVISVHEQISKEKIRKPFPYHIIIPIAASVIGVIGLGYFLLFRPSPKQAAEPHPPEIERDPYHEVYELTPEEQQEFIKMINQRYYGE